MHWFLLLALLAQDTATLTPKAAAGDKTTVTVESAVDLDINVTDGGGKSTKLLSVGRKEKFVQEVTEAAEGKPKALRILCLSSTVQKSGTGLPLTEPQSTAIEGQTYLLTRLAANWVVKDKDGNPPPADGQALGAWNDAVRLLPKGAVKVSDTWKVEAKEVKALIAPVAAAEFAGTLKCTCESLMENKATILFEGTLTGKGKDDSSLKLTISAGRLVFDAEKGRLVSVTAGSSIESLQELTEVVRKEAGGEEEKRKEGEIAGKSRKLDIAFTFE